MIRPSTSPDACETCSSRRAYLDVVIDAQTDTEIGTTGKFFRFLRVLPSCLVTGSMFQVDAGGVNQDESPALIARVPESAYPYDGHNFTAHDTVLLQNSVADVAALVAS